MEIFKIENLSFSYPNTDYMAINGVSLSINSGDFVTIFGPSGCGKSTLLKHLKPMLAPCGNLKGDIYFNNVNINKISQRELSAKIGFVMQSPDSQIVTDKVWHELAFGLENLGYNNSEIKKRVADAMCS